MIEQPKKASEPARPNVNAPGKTPETKPAQSAPGQQTQAPPAQKPNPEQRK